jgi:uncharacterized membrane protein YjjP (DUF1212 family)
VADPDPAGYRAGDPVGDAALHTFVLELGSALSLAGTAVSETQERLTRIAAANGMPDARVVVLPTTLLISFGRAHPTAIEPIPQGGGELRLDQIAELYELARRAARGSIAPDAGLAALRRIHAMRPRHGFVVTILGYSLMTAALCLLQRPPLPDVAIAAALGACVGILVLLARGHQALSVLVPVVAAAGVSALALQAVRHGIADPGLQTLVAPLVTFLPGAALTTATVELASGEMVAGASRLVSGGLRMLLLAFGIVAGAELAGLPSRDALYETHPATLAWWVPWLGVVAFGVAAAAYFSAPRGTLGWLLLVLLTAWTGQLAGERLAGPAVSGFFGALAMTPVALAVARLPGGPPSQVTFLPAFWLLVPGAVGLVGATEVVGDPAAAGLEDIVEPMAAIVAIALGVLCGASATRGLAAAASRAG